jgi:hypothetical protein
MGERRIIDFYTLLALFSWDSQNSETLILSFYPTNCTPGMALESVILVFFGKIPGWIEVLIGIPRKSAVE